MECENFFQRIDLDIKVRFLAVNKIDQLMSVVFSFMFVDRPHGAASLYLGALVSGILSQEKIPLIAMQFIQGNDIACNLEIKM